MVHLLKIKNITTEAKNCTKMELKEDFKVKKIIFKKIK